MCELLYNNRPHVGSLAKLEFLRYFQQLSQHVHANPAVLINSLCLSVCKHERTPEPLNGLYNIVYYRILPINVESLSNHGSFRLN